MSRSTVLVAVGIAVMLVAGVLGGVILSRLGGGVDLTSVDLRLERLEERIDLLAQSLERAPVTAAPTTSEPSIPETATQDRAETEDGDGEEPTLADVLGRLDGFDSRLRALEEDPIERGYTFIDSDSPELRRRGIRALASLARSDPEARAAIRRLIGDGDAGVRETAIDVISDLQDKEAIPQLLGALSDPAANVREEAVDALADVGAREEGGLAIAGLLEDPAANVREEAADVLGRLKFAGGEDFLVQALRDSNADVRGQAISSLGEIGAKSAAPLLRRMYDDDPGRDRWRLVYALRSLGDTEPYLGEIRRLSDTALRGDDERSRRDALRWLAGNARTDAADVFRQALEDPSPRVREVAESALRPQRERGRRR